MFANHPRIPVVPVLDPIEEWLIRDEDNPPFDERYSLTNYEVFMYNQYSGRRPWLNEDGTQNTRVSKSFFNYGS